GQRADGAVHGPRQPAGRAVRRRRCVAAAVRGDDARREGWRLLRAGWMVRTSRLPEEGRLHRGSAQCRERPPALGALGEGDGRDLRLEAGLRLAGTAKTMVQRMIDLMRAMRSASSRGSTPSAPMFSRT